MNMIFNGPDGGFISYRDEWSEPKRDNDFIMGYTRRELMPWCFVVGRYVSRMID